MIDKIVLFIVIFLFAALVLSVLGTYIILGMDKTDEKVKKEKKAWQNKLDCQKVKMKLNRVLWDDYFWHKPSRFMFISLVFVGAISLTLLYPSIITIVFGLIVFTLYILFLSWAYKRYKKFPLIAKDKLVEFQKPIKDGVEKAVAFPGDLIRKYLAEDEYISEDINAIKQFEFKEDVTKISSTPYSGKKSIISTEKLSYVVLTNEFIVAFPNASKFNLLNPAVDEKKSCVEKKGALGASGNEHYYSYIHHGKFDEEKGGIVIVHKDDEKTEHLFFKCKKKDAAGVLSALKEKLRITERQKLRKVDEYAKMEYIKKLRDIEKENELQDEEEKKDES